MVFGLVNWFNAELSPKRYWRGPRSQEVGGGGGGGGGGREWKREIIPNDTLSPPE